MTPEISESLPESSTSPQVPNEVKVIRVIEKQKSGLDAWATHILGVLSIGGVLYILRDFLMVKCEKDTALIIVGGLLTLLSSIVSYYFGSSQGSRGKDAIIADLKTRLEKRDENPR